MIISVSLIKKNYLNRKVFKVSTLKSLNSNLKNRPNNNLISTHPQLF